MFYIFIMSLVISPLLQFYKGSGEIARRGRFSVAEGIALAVRKVGEEGRQLARSDS